MNAHRGDRPPKNYGGTAASGQSGSGRGEQGGQIRDLSAGPDVQNFAFPRYDSLRRSGSNPLHKMVDESGASTGLPAAIPAEFMMTESLASAHPEPFGHPMQPTPPTQFPQSPQKPTGGSSDLGALLAEMKLSSGELLLIVLVVYFLNSHADDEMAVLLLILLGLGL